MAVLFTRGKQIAKKFGVLLRNYVSIDNFFFLKSIKTMVHIIISKPMALYFKYVFKIKTFRTRLIKLKCLHTKDIAI